MRAEPLRGGDPGPVYGCFSLGSADKHSVPFKHLVKFIVEVLKLVFGLSEKSTVICIHQAGDALLVSHVL